MRIRNYILYIPVMIFLLCATGCGSSQEIITYNEDGSTESVSYDHEDAGTKGSNDEADTADQDVMNIYICGAVKSPGVYRLPAGSIVNDVLLLAGGILPDAAADSVNLAEKLADGDMIYFPYASETDAAFMAGGRSIDTEKSDGLININKASKEELMTLQGIGEAKAEAIIDYREKSGPFSNIEEIKNVNGIGERLFDSIKDLITV